MDCKIVELPLVIGVAIDVLCGAYGDGEDRKARLRQEGFDYAVVQGCVNDIYELLQKYKEKSCLI